MSEQAAVVADTSSAPVMDVARGPLVDITPEQRTEFRKTGNLPKIEEPAASDAGKEPISEKADPESASKQDSTDRKPVRRPDAEQRIQSLTDENKRIKAELDALKVKPSETKPEPKVEPKIEATRPKPTSVDKDDDGKDKYATYEDYIEDLTEWKAEQREAKNQKEQRELAASKEFDQEIERARVKYKDFIDIVKPFATAINTDAKVSPVVKQMFLDSTVLSDLLYTIGGKEEESAKFLKMAKEEPGKAIRYIALTESLIKDELESKPSAEEAPAKPKTQAPKPPSEAGGRAAAPPDALEAAAKANDFRSFREESTRRQLAKLKG